MCTLFLCKLSKSALSFKPTHDMIDTSSIFGTIKSSNFTIISFVCPFILLLLPGFRITEQVQDQTSDPKYQVLGKEINRKRSHSSGYSQPLKTTISELNLSTPSSSKVALLDIKQVNTVWPKRTKDLARIYT